MTSDAEREELARERAVALDLEFTTTAAPQPVAKTPQPAEEPPSQPEPQPSVPLVYQDRFNLLELLELYDSGRLALKRGDHARWRATFALAASNRGVYSGRVDGVVRLLGVFWTTKNVHIDLRREVPHLHPDGNYVYIAWFWNETEEDGAAALRAHVRRVLPDAEFIAWHDQRGKTGRRKLFVLDLTASEPE